MSIERLGSNIVVNESVAGSVFPANEKDTILPVLVDGTRDQIKIEGALYGRAVELRGDVLIHGPVVARGDLRINPLGKRIQLRSGLTVNGNARVHASANGDGQQAIENIQDACFIIKGDVAVNQNLALKNTLVFGSVRAVNCLLEHTVVLGTCIVDESLTLRMSSVGGYASRDVTFEGSCLMIHALGESLSRPRFLPFEAASGEIVRCDLRYYAAVRSLNHLFNLAHRSGLEYPDYSALHESTDWLESRAAPNLALDELQAEAMNKWVLSIGGRIGDISVIAQAIDSMTKLLKCGFEYEHYHPQKRAQIMSRVLDLLTPDESWALKTVCQ